MKNLKKVLALGLALIMLLGMFTVVSAAETKKAASDLTDWDTVVHKDAVALMVDLGIIKGMPDGTFNPTGNIDRASWAKMVYYAATGSEDADAYLGTNTGLKDIAGNWAEAYISYLKANDYISGDTAGNYNPSNNVTVAEANKMMLTVLGYDAEDRHYQNSATWSANIMNDAKRYGLMDDVDRTQTALVPLTRENAAQIVYNALKANTVTTGVQWDGGVKHITSYNIDQTLGFSVFGVVPVEVTVTGIDTNGNAEVKANADTVEGITVVSSLGGKVKASPSVVGEQVVIWAEVDKAVYDPKTGNLDEVSGFIKVISSAVAKSKSAADVTLTKGFNWADLTNNAKSNFVATNFVGGDKNETVMTSDSLGDVQIFINGVLNGGKTTVAEAAGEINKVTWDNDTQEEQSGAVVEFYLNKDGEIATVRAYIYNVDQMEGDVETRTTTSGTQQVRLPGISQGGVNLGTWKDADKITGWQGLKDKDVVLFYAGQNDTVVIEKAEKVTGVVTARNSSGQITVGGTKYKRTNMGAAAPAYGNGVTTPDGKSNNQANFSNWYNREDEFAFYLDKTGAVCFTEQITETLTKSNIALVMAAEWNGTSMSTSTGKLQAKLLFMDGTQQIVDVSKLEGLEVVTTMSTGTAKDKQIQGAKPGTSGTVTECDSIAEADRKAANNGYDYAINELKAGTMTAFYNYRVVSGKYELTKVVAAENGTTEDDWGATQVINGSKIEKKADFANSNGAEDTWTADSKTVFLVAKGTGDDKTYFTYTSYKNVPEMEKASGLAVGTCESGAAKYVYLDTEGYSDDVPDGYVFIYDNKYEDDPKNEDAYLIHIIDANGNQTTLSVDSTIAGKLKSDSNKPGDSGYLETNFLGHFCSVDKIDENGVVSELTPVTDAVEITALGNEVVNEFSYDSVTKFVYVDMIVNDGDNAVSATDDTLEFSGAGTFSPNGFYKASDVDTTEGHLPGSIASSEATASFASVQMFIITDAKGEVADYVYILRVVW